MSDPTIDRIKEQLESPLPTPKVGDVVYWHDRGQIKEEHEAAAAIVTKIEDAGKVSLTLFLPNGEKHKTGVHFIGHEIHQNPNNSGTVHNGAWSYRGNIPKTHYEYHTAILKRRMEAYLEDKRRHQEAAEARQKLQEQAAGKQPAGSAR